MVIVLKLVFKDKGKDSFFYSFVVSWFIIILIGLVLSERRNEEFFIEDYDLERWEYILNLNYDKLFISYGFFELNVVDFFVLNSGIIGYWDKIDKVFVSILYFGVWWRWVCKFY